MNQAQVYVFTPRGDVIPLPVGATPVDFAYAVHTEVGHHTIGSRVNGRLVPLESSLENGDVVEVFTSKAPTAGPSRDWLELRPVAAGALQDPPVVHQGAPRGGHRARQGPDRQAHAQGGPAPQPADDPRRAVAGRRALPPRRRLGALRRGRRGQPQRPGRRTPCHRPARRRRRRGRRTSSEGVTITGRGRTPKQGPTDSGVVVNGVDDLWVKLAKCCTPVPPDRILGFVTKGGGVSVHRTRLHQRRRACSASPSGCSRWSGRPPRSRPSWSTSRSRPSTGRGCCPTSPWRSPTPT